LFPLINYVESPINI